jgi:TP901 family phage tail tape measure protein
MADNLITTNITANADFTGLRTQLAATTAQLLKLQEVTAGTNAKLANQIAVMNKAFATTLTSTGQFSQHFVSLTSDVEKFGRNLDRGRLKLNDYYNTWSGHTKKTSNLVRDLAKQQVMLEQAIIQPIGKNAQGLMQYNVMVAKGLDEVKNRTAIARQELAIMNKVMLDGSNQLINWGKNTQWAGRQLTVGLTVPLAAFGMAAQKAFRAADEELVRLTKVYGGLSAVSATELAKVRKDVSATAREIAGSYGIAFKDTIALAADLAATGQEGENLLKATRETSRLAILGEVDRQEAMKATLAIQNAFKQNTDELSASINFLNAVENQTSTTLQDLTEAIPKAGPVVKSLGGDVQDLALYLTAMKEGGVNASEGANAIKSAMASLINPTKVAKELFLGFGIDLDNIVTSNAGNLTGTIIELQGALDKLDPLSKSRAIEQLFGKFQYARLSALFENIGREGSQTLQVMELMGASATDLAGIAERELGMITESASGKFKRALASVQADLAVVGEQFLRISTKILEVVDGIIKFFQKLPEPVKTFLNVLGGITAVSGPIIMLAGVMGNFIGYVIKGIFHLRQLVRGGQGFKLLTPEIMAADAAAKGLATSFYSDTEATIVLTNAVNTLAASFDTLQIKADAAKVSVQPAISTVAGGVIAAGTPGGQRFVDKNNPLVGKAYTRDMSHFTPSATDQMGTIFGTVPGAKPVNIRVGKNPQAYMNQDLPKIPGVTSVNGISTGIVAQEAAKWHAMTAAIAMQSEAEIKILKAEVMATGTITSSLADSYQALLPQFSEITELAAQETAAIVKQLQASKITADQARAKVIQLNATVEAMLAETTALTAGTMGRTANLTMVPLTSQPVVDPATGKSNMKEMFHKGPTKTLVDRIARALGGVRTSGAGYNIETTKPKFNKGGIVPGTGNTDTYHTLAEPESFVINKAATERNMPTISKLLGGTPTFRNTGGMIPVVLTPGEAVIPARIAKPNMNLMMQLNGGPGNTTGMGRHKGGSAHPHPHVEVPKLSKEEIALLPQKKQELLTIHDALADKDYYEKNRTRYILNAAWAIKQGGSKSSNPITNDQAVRYAEEMFEEHVRLSGGNQKRFEYLAEGPIQESIEKKLRKEHPKFKLLLPKNLSDAVINAKTKKEKTKAISRIRGKSPILAPQERGEIWNLMKGRDGINQSALLEIDPISPNAVDRAHGRPIGNLARHSIGYAGQAVVLPENLNKIMYRYEQFGLSKNWLPTFTPEASREARTFLRRIGLDQGVSIDEVKKAAKISKTPRQFQAVLYAATMGGGGAAWLRAFNRGRVVFNGLPGAVPLNKGGKVPGGFAQRLFGGGKPLFLGMPKTIKQVETQRAAKVAMEKADQAVKNSRYSKDKVTTYDEKLQSDDKGHSFPVGGIGGIYSRNGEKFFVKPVVSEKRALGESRFNKITNDLENGLKAPDQRVVVIKDPTDPAGRRKVLALESKYDTDFANMPDTFDEDTYFKQLALSALRGDKDLARGNLGGNRVADGGTSGVFNTASGDADYSATMPSFKHQAIVNLLGVKGSSTKKFFAEATSDIPKGMTADQYHQRMLDEIENVLPRLKQTISRFDLNPEETVVYNAMIQRLSDARRENYRDLHALHSSIEIAPKKQMTPAAIAKMIAADELKRRQKGHAVSLSDNAFKTPENGFNIGGLIGNVLKGRAMHRIGAGFGPTGAPKPSMYESAPWGVNSLSIEMADKLFANTGLRKHTQKLFYDKFAAALAKEKPYGYVKDVQGSLKKALEPDVLDSVIRSAASDMISDRAVLSKLSPIDKDILKQKYLNWDSKKDTPLTESLKKVIFGLEKREMGGPVNSGQPYVVGEKGPELFVPRNSGGIVPHNKYGIAQGYNMGGMIKMMIMSMLGMQGGMAVGKMSGLPGGEMIGATLGSMLGYGAMGGAGEAGKVPLMEKSRSKTPLFATKTGPTMEGVKGEKELTRYGKGLESWSASGNKLKSVASMAGKALTRLNLAVGAGALAVAAAKNRWDAYKESMRLNALGYGMTAEGAEKAGLKFTNFNDKIKEAIDNAKALKERNTLLYESMAPGGTPLDITIEEYKKLKKEVKDNYSDQVLLINKTSAGDQEALAVRLKEQLVAMGLSAEEATKKIYTMYASSDFSGSAAKYTVQSEAFNKIKDSASAAVSAIESLNAAMATDRDPTEQANQFNTAMMAISTDLEKRQTDAIKKATALATKEGRYLSTGDQKQIKLDQEKIAMDEINSKVTNQVVLTKDLVNELAKVDPSIKQIVNSQDTAVSLWQKTRIQVKGYTGDLKLLTAAQTNDLYNLQTALGKAIETANRAKGGALEKQYATLDKNKKLQAAYERAAKGQKVADQISDREKMSALQKQIDLNNKLADARIKALTAAKEEGDIGREIAKKQAEYDAALATGNTAGAQQASLDMEGLIGQQQFNAQVRNEENARDVKNAPLLKQIQAMQNKQQKLSDNAALAGEKLGDLTKVIATQETAIEEVNTAMTNYEIELLKQPPMMREQWKLGTESGKMLAAVATAAEKAGVKLNGLKDLDLARALTSGLDSKLGAVSTIDVKGNVSIIVDGKKFDIGADSGSGTKSDPYSLGKAGVGTETLSNVDISKYGSVTDFGPFGAGQKLKKLAAEKGINAGEYFSVTDKDGKISTYKVRDDGNITRTVSPYATGGIVPRYSEGSGGKVRGAGTSTSDSIPAMLSNGEYVVRASAVSQYGVPFFDKVNAQKFAFGGMVNMPRYETGGQVLTADMGGFNTNANNATMGGATINITNNINGFDGDINQLSRLVTQQTVTAIKSMDSRAASALGPKMNVGIS